MPSLIGLWQFQRVKMEMGNIAVTDTAVTSESAIMALKF